jgi:hypothetical protein
MRAYSAIGRAWADYNERGIGKGHRKVPRVRFEGTRLISYHTCVARYVTGPLGQYVLVTSTTYSVSTSSHVRNCAYAGSGPHFTVPWIDYSGREQENFAHLASLITAKIEQARKAWNPERSWHARYVNEHWISWLTTAHRTAASYAKHAGVKADLPNLDTLVAETAHYRAAKLAEWMTPTKVAARHRAHARRIAKQALGI